MKILTLILIILSFTFLTAMAPLDEIDKEYYQSAFPGAKYFERFIILDPITEGEINKNLLHIFNANKELLGYIREVSTTPGCESLCKPLEFTLAFNPQGIYQQYLVRMPLTKKAHKKFSEADYKKLQNILETPPPSFGTANNPSDLVDEPTMATKIAYKDDVVKGAALTCFRVHQYKQNTSEQLTTMYGTRNNESNPPSSRTLNDTPSNLGQAIDFTLPNLNEEDITFSYEKPSPYKGKITALIFFGSWCSWCKQELPMFQTIYDNYKSNPEVAFLAVRTFRNNEHEDINDFVNNLALTFPIVSDTPRENPPYSRVARMYNVPWIPYTIIFGKDGQIRFIPQVETLEEYIPTVTNNIENLLNEN